MYIYYINSRRSENGCVYMQESMTDLSLIPGHFITTFYHSIKSATVNQCEVALLPLNN